MLEAATGLNVSYRSVDRALTRLFLAKTARITTLGREITHKKNVGRTRTQ